VQYCYLRLDTFSPSKIQTIPPSESRPNSGFATIDRFKESR
jgi:hypothetical protein